MVLTHTNPGAPAQPVTGLPPLLPTQLQTLADMLNRTAVRYGEPGRYQAIERRAAARVSA